MALSALLGAGVLLGGCAAPLERRPATEEAFVGDGASSWDLVFDSPSVNRALASADRTGFAEFHRADRRLNVRPDAPLLASNQWPEAERASLAYPRRVSIPTRADSLLFFEGESERRGYRGDGAGAWRGGSSYAEPGGTWGFWR